MDAIGVDRAARAERKLSFHSMRHTFVTRAREAGLSDFVVSALSGHKTPSGSALSSPEDNEITKRLSMAAEIIGINALDHIIITPKDNYYSYRKDGKMPYTHQAYELENFVGSLEKGYAE